MRRGKLKAREIRNIVEKARKRKEEKVEKNSKVRSPKKLARSTLAKGYHRAPLFV